MVEYIDNPRFPHWCCITRPSPNDDPMSDAGEECVIYEGACRSFDNHTTNQRGDVINSVRKLSLPVLQSQWGPGMPIPLEGDTIKVCKCSHCEYGIVKDKMPGNLGTHILWEYVRE